MPEEVYPMPLVDHFHAPIHPIHSWESFHSRWAGTLADALSVLLPYPRYLVEVQTTLGSRFEADVLEWELEREETQGNGANGGVAVQTQTYTAPAAVCSLEFSFPDDFEVRAFDLREGKSLVGVIELVSPANKDRSEHCRAFAAKCLSYLHRGIGVVVVDIVTERHANLHNELMELLAKEDEASFPSECYLYAVSYRPVRRSEQNRLDLWPVSLELERPLPVLPLTLRGGPTIPVDLESSYSDARRRSHI
jgi:hypothetical protein